MTLTAPVLFRASLTPARFPILDLVGSTTFSGVTARSWPKLDAFLRNRSML